MGFLGKIVEGGKWLGNKLAAAGSWLGNKIAPVAMRVAPMLGAFNPALGAAVGSAGLALKGIGSIADAARGAINGAPTDYNKMRDDVQGIGGNLRIAKQNVAAAYADVRSRGSRSEKAV